MKNSDNSLSCPNSSKLPNASLEANEEYPDIASLAPLINNTISTTGPETEAFNHGIGDSSVDGDVGGSKSGKPRGRPCGSKNKPRGHLERKVSANMVVLNIPPQADIVNYVVQFAKSKQLSITIVSASGLISTVDLCHPVPTNPHSTISGPLQLISLSGTFQWSSISSATSFFSCVLKRFDNQIFAGEVASKMISLSPVVLVVTTYSNTDI